MARLDFSDSEFVNNFGQLATVEVYLTLTAKTNNPMQMITWRKFTDTIEELFSLSDFMSFFDLEDGEISLTDEHKDWMGW